MRVHEFAKQHGLSSKEMLDLLKAEGFEAKSHMSVLSDDVLKFFEKRNPAQEKSAQQPLKVKEVPSPKKVEERQEPLAATHSQPKNNSKPQFMRPSSAPVISEPVVPAVTTLVAEAMSVSDFAQRVQLPINEVILALLKQGKPCAKNYLLPEDMVKQLCRHYQIEIQAPVAEKKDVLTGEFVLSTVNEKKRLPVVVVMGHVDHGKTTLLDFIRTTRVAAKEKGGITQHLGAYSAKTPHGDIVFLDTPGHEAFSKIRKRGASVADIAILVVAADDGIMPQTVESIKAIKALDIPVIVAINKMDRVEPQRLETVKRQLVQHELLPEEWGGTVICAPISAKEGTGVDHLLELVALQAEMMELKASDSIPAQGYVLESRMVKGLGAVGTVLCGQGTLRLGDSFIAGSVTGKVIALTDSFGKKLKEVGPSTPVLVAGFSDLPSVGEMFEVISEAEYKKARALSEKPAMVQSQSSTSQEERFNVIIKADTHSSLEAILDSFKEISSKKGLKTIHIIRSGVGDVTESDALLAESTHALVLGFNNKAEQKATFEARRSGVKIVLYGIIYKLLEELELLATKAQVVTMVLTKIGQATVLKIFNVKKLGVIAGCVVNDGRLSDKGIIAIIRNRKEVARGKIKSLQRDKKTVKEVHTGFECAFIVEGFEEWEEGDVAECYINVPTPGKPA